jgi:hypothetical protein
VVHLTAQLAIRHPANVGEHSPEVAKNDSNPGAWLAWHADVLLQPVRCYRHRFYHNDPEYRNMYGPRTASTTAVAPWLLDTQA